jgi:hypothetical protein
MCKRCDNNPGFVKVRFRDADNGATAGLVLSRTKARHTTVTDLSRMFPVSEFRKMSVLELSPVYPTWEGAFAHDFA